MFRRTTPSSGSRRLVTSSARRSGVSGDQWCAEDARRARQVGRRLGEDGYTILELVVALMLIAIFSVIALGILDGRIEKARLARCMIDLRSVQTTIWSLSDGVDWPAPITVWRYAFGGMTPKYYHYLINNSDRNSGHGNDMDICDEENPGKSTTNRDCEDIEFVILCQHDHGILANYVYIEDEGPPTIAGWSRAADPGYDRFIGKPYSDGGGGDAGRDPGGGKGLKPK